MRGESQTQKPQSSGRGGGSGLWDGGVLGPRHPEAWWKGFWPHPCGPAGGWQTDPRLSSLVKARLAAMTVFSKTSHALAQQKQLLCSSTSRPKEEWGATLSSCDSLGAKYVFSRE